MAEHLRPYLEPVRQTVQISGSPAEAFDRFTSRFGDWWPLRPPYCVFGEDTLSCGLEPHLGGAVFEISKRGERCVWGRIVQWEPPARLVFTWFPGRREETSQTVEVRFDAIAGGTQLTLEHRDWQRYGDGDVAARSSYEGGWPVVLAAFKGA